MLLYLTNDELKCLDVAISNNNFEFIADGLPLYENREKYYELEKRYMRN